MKWVKSFLLFSVFLLMVVCMEDPKAKKLKVEHPGGSAQDGMNEQLDHLIAKEHLDETELMQLGQYAKLTISLPHSVDHFVTSALTSSSIVQIDTLNKIWALRHSLLRLGIQRILSRNYLKALASAALMDVSMEKISKTFDIFNEMDDVSPSPYRMRKKIFTLSWEFKNFLKSINDQFFAKLAPRLLATKSRVDRNYVAERIQNLPDEHFQTFKMEFVHQKEFYEADAAILETIKQKPKLLELLTRNEMMDALRDRSKPCRLSIVSNLFEKEEFMQEFDTVSLNQFMIDASRFDRWDDSFFERMKLFQSKLSKETINQIFRNFIRMNPIRYRKIDVSLDIILDDTFKNQLDVSTLNFAISLKSKLSNDGENSFNRLILHILSDSTLNEKLDNETIKSLMNECIQRQLYGFAMSMIKVEAIRKQLDIEQVRDIVLLAIDERGELMPNSRKISHAFLTELITFKDTGFLDAVYKASPYAESVLKFMKHYRLDAARNYI